VAIGNGASAAGGNSVSIGFGNSASGNGAVAIGDPNVAAGTGAVAIGENNLAMGRGAVALGNGNNASGIGAVAIGDLTTAKGPGATAIGQGATSNFSSATAVGTNAATSRANQIKLGGSGSSVTIGDIAASTAMQAGPSDVATVDASGTVGRDTTLRPAITSLQSTSATQGSAIAAMLTQNLAQNDRISALEAGQSALSNRVDSNGRAANAGIAAAMALGGTMVVPDSNVTVNFNLANYRGQQGFSGSVVGRVSPKLYVSAGVAGSTIKGSTGSRIGIAFGF
jgi:trimeric autotransporter adhesin